MKKDKMKNRIYDTGRGISLLTALKRLSGFTIKMKDSHDGRSADTVRVYGSVPHSDIMERIGYEYYTEQVCINEFCSCLWK